MKTGLGKSALLLSFAIVSFSGCKTPPFCPALGATGGDLLGNLPNGATHRSWTVTADYACQDQLQLPPVAVSLVRQPPAVANQRPPDPVTDDWCGNLVIDSSGNVHEFIVYAPPLPIKVAALTISEDYDGNTTRGTYLYQQTIDQTRNLTFSESCLTAQGMRLTCPVLGRKLGDFLAAEANIYSMRCQDPANPGQGGCECQFELSFIGGSSGRWALQESGTQVVFFDMSYAPAAFVDFSFTPAANIQIPTLTGSGSLNLTGSNETPLFNQKGLRTLELSPPSCTNGLLDVDNGETGIDCGGPNCPQCGTCIPAGNTAPGCTCQNGMHDTNEQGIDCGGACLGVLCSNDPKKTADQQLPACANGIQDPWEEGVDCGGPCSTQCPGALP
jgi:hypothetical protein